MSKKVNYYVASRELSENVVAFMKSFIWKKEIQLRYQKAINAEITRKESYAKLENSMLAKTPEEIAQIDADILKLEESRDAELKSNLYDYNKIDKEFLASIVKAKNNVAVDTCIMKWLKNYFPVEAIVGTSLIEDLHEVINKKVDIKVIVNTDSEEVFKTKGSESLVNMYGYLYREMCKAHTIKKHQIPEIVREKYIEKKKESKKESKNSESK